MQHRTPSLDWYLSVISTMDIEDFNAWVEGKLADTTEE